MNLKYLYIPLIIVISLEGTTGSEKRKDIYKLARKHEKVGF